MKEKIERCETGRTDRYNVPEELDYLTAASANDCTGLIPGGVIKEEMLDSYHEIYPFGTPGR